MGKVVGISFGRKMSNTEIMIKAALEVCAQRGHEIEFIRAMDLDIKQCTGCTACVGGLISGKTTGTCVFKDDIAVIHEALYSCDAIMVGSPVFETSPSGLYKAVCDRMGPSHDISFLKTAYDERKAAGADPKLLPDERAFKKRVGVLWASGGAMTKNWTALTLPVMYELMMSTGVDVIDAHVQYAAMKQSHVLGDEAEMERARQAGEHIADAIEAETEEKRTAWRGDEEGACPVCHMDLITMFPGSSRIECPICGIEGTLEFTDGVPRAVFSEAEQKRSRLFYAGKLEHSNEIKNGARTMKVVPDLKEKLEKYRNIGV